MKSDMLKCENNDMGKHDRKGQGMNKTYHSILGGLLMLGSLIFPGIAQANLLPTVSIPTTLATGYAPGSNIVLRASASDKDGTVTQVDFYANDGTNNVLVGSDTVAGWAIAWKGVAAGTYQITAVATDNLGGVTTSAPFTIMVDAQYNIAPTVIIPTTLPSTYAPGANIVLRASASDKDGTVTQVDFYANDGTNNVLVGSDTVAGWAIAWKGVAAGTYQITTVATDNLGGVTTSAPFTIMVDAQYNIAPTVVIPTTLPTGYAPGSNIVLRASASDKDGTVTQVDFYANDGTNNVLVGSDTVAGWAISWKGVAAGTYQITAVATDNLGGTTTSAPFTITVDAQYNIAPTVVIPPTLPTGYAPGSNIVLRASASDKDGTVTQVDFYANDGTNNVLVGSDTVAGWAFKWMNVAAGTYQITAVATDNLGGTTTSAPFTITVDAQYNIAPTVVIPTTLPTGYAPGSNIVLRASASDKDGTVTQVDFYANDGTNSVLVGSDTVAGWAIAWKGVAAGTYQITAVATDNLGATSTSAPYTITVGTPEAQVYYIHTDHLATPRMITDTAGNVVWDWQNLDPFGNNEPNENPSGLGTFEFPLRFKGQTHDKETGLNYNYFRDYDPVIGRYIESDPIGLMGGINTFAYVGANPIKFIDPWGLRCNGTGCWTTPGERSFLNKGDYLGYYQNACAGGDAYACYAQHIAANDNFWGHLATNRLKDALEKHASDSHQCINESEIMNQIRNDLANAYANYLPDSEAQASFPTAEGVAKFHWDEFAKFGLPSSTFGGTPFGATPILPSLWCPNCR